MAEVKELTGQVFERLTVIATEKANRGNTCTVRCSCAAQTTFKVAAHRLTTLHQKSCGCIQQEGRDRAQADLTGKVFGYITVVGFSHKKSGNSFWNIKCLCDPKRIWSVSASQLIQKKTRSCGCFQREDLSIRVRSAPYQNIYNHLTRMAKGRCSVDLSFGEYVEFTKQSNCHYCETTLRWAEYKIAGQPFGHNLDRKDSSKGYSVDNCVPCCGGCNESKMTRPYEEWVEIGKAIKMYREGKRILYG